MWDRLTKEHTAGHTKWHLVGSGVLAPNPATGPGLPVSVLVSWLLMALRVTIPKPPCPALSALRAGFIEHPQPTGHSQPQQCLDPIPAPRGFPLLHGQQPLSPAQPLQATSDLFDAKNYCLVLVFVVVCFVFGKTGV
jgi:hypothetical protein